MKKQPDPNEPVTVKLASGKWAVTTTDTIRLPRERAAVEALLHPDAECFPELKAEELAAACAEAFRRLEAQRNGVDATAYFSRFPNRADAYRKIGSLIGALEVPA